MLCIRLGHDISFMVHVERNIPQVLHGEFASVDLFYLKV